MKYHLSENGPSPCKAKTPESCPLKDSQGSKVEHFSNFEEAQSKFEENNENKEFQGVKKEKKPLDKPRLTIYHGLPGSGKSTIAEKQIEENKHYSERVNRDDIRTELFGEEYHKRGPNKKAEAEVTKVQNERFEKIFKKNGNAISDDTNLNPKTLQSLMKIAKEHKAEIEQIYVETSPEEAKRRNRLRGESGGRFVPENVIDSMARGAFSKDGRIKDFIFSNNGVFKVDKITPGSKIIDAANERLLKKYPLVSDKAVIIDCDGTLANNASDAQKFLHGKKKDFTGFYKSIENAEVNQDVVELAKTYRKNGVNSILLTGREDSHANELVQFVEKSGAPISKVIAKRNGDFRPDYEFKAEAAKKLNDENLKIVGAVDDRPQSVDFWNKSGVPVDVVEYRKGDASYNSETPKISVSSKSFLNSNKERISSKTIGLKGGSYIGAPVEKSNIQNLHDEFRKTVGDEKYENLVGNRINRDKGDFHHVTVLSPKETRDLKKKGVKIPEGSVMNFNLKGLGKVESGEDGREAWFGVVSSEEADSYRENLGLEKKDFHITLGFDKKDVFDKPKDDSSIVKRL